MRHSIFAKQFSVFLAFIPIAAMYATPIPGINAAEIVLLYYWVIMVFIGKPISLTTLNTRFLSLAGFMYISFFVASLRYGFSTAAFIRLVRFSFYHVSAVILGGVWFDFEVFCKWIRRIAVAAIAFILIQYASYYLLGRVLTGMIPGLPVYQSEYTTLDYAEFYRKVFFRPTSFFLEPASYSQFMFMPLVAALWKEERPIWAIAITGGIVLSTSGQGIVISACLWAFYFVGILKKKGMSRSQFKKALQCFLVTVPVFLILLQTELLQKSIGRLMQTGSQSASSARMGSYVYIFNDQTLFDILIGHGYGNVPNGSWMAGLALLGLWFWLRGGPLPNEIPVLWVVYKRTNDPRYGNRICSDTCSGKCTK